MKLWSSSRCLGVLSILSLVALFVCTSATSGKLRRMASAPLNQFGAAVILQADGTAPEPPPPPPPKQNQSSTIVA